MQALPLCGERARDRLSLVKGDNPARENQLNLLLSLELLIAAAGVQRRDGLEPPLLVGDAAEGVVAVVNNLALPSSVLGLPLGPLPGGVADGLVDVAGVLGGGGDVQALGVEEGAARRYGEEVDAHRGSDGEDPGRSCWPMRVWRRETEGAALPSGCGMRTRRVVPIWGGGWWPEGRRRR